MAPSTFIVTVLCIAVTVLGGCDSAREYPGLKLDGSEVTTSTGLRYIDIVVGTGAEAIAGKFATVHYTGYLMDGKKFDSSLDRGQPFPSMVGAGRFDQGVG